LLFLFLHELLTITDLFRAGGRIYLDIDWADIFLREWLASILLQDLTPLLLNLLLCLLISLDLLKLPSHWALPPFLSLILLVIVTSNLVDISVADILKIDKRLLHSLRTILSYCLKFRIYNLLWSSHWSMMYRACNNSWWLINSKWFWLLWHNFRLKLLLDWSRALDTGSFCLVKVMSLLPRLSILYHAGLDLLHLLRRKQRLVD
jgi:hypothetical protein